MTRAAILLAGGALAVAVAELAPVAELRFVAALLLIAGAILAGIAGSQRPLPASLSRMAGSRRLPYVVLGVLALPAATTFIAAMIGAGGNAASSTLGAGGVATREILYNATKVDALLMYLGMALPAAVLAYGLARRIRRWRAGRAENRVDRIAERLSYLLRASILHGRIVRRRNLYAGIMHACLFTGFVGLLIGTLIVMVEADVAQPFFRTSLLHGVFYLTFKLAMNACGLLLVAGAAMALYRRLVLKPETLETSRDDVVILAALLVLAAQGYAQQALRLAATADPWAQWSFVSYPFALGLAGYGADTLRTLHRIGWLTHFATAFVFFAYVAGSKMMHPVMAMASVFFRRLQPRGELPPIRDMDTAETFGAGKLEDFTWPQLLSLDACLHCGRCLEYCPTFSTGKTLRPRDLVLELAGFQADRGGVFSGVLGADANTGRYRWGKGPDRELIGGVVSEEEIWDCTTCGACMEQCPVHIEPAPMIVEMRRHLVMERNSFPRELASTFASLERLGNPYQGVPKDRAAWTRKLESPVREMAEVKAAGETVEYLFFVGCVGSFVGRNQKITVALARILQSAGISFAILGKEESCNGDAARRVGNEYLARELAAKTVETFNAYGVRKVVTACAHCFNAIRNEFPQLGGEYEVVHHSELIAELIASGRLPSKAKAELEAVKITYHDPCYLGRYNGVFDAPRKAVNAISAIPIVEMPRHGRESFCCGAGGGHAFMKEDRGTRINQARAREALDTGAEVVAASCSFCIGMLEDGITGIGASSRLRVLDIAELVADAAEPEPAPISSTTIAPEHTLP